MGLKSGSRDAGLNESEDEAEQSDEQKAGESQLDNPKTAENAQIDDETQVGSSSGEATTANSESAAPSTTDSQRPTMQSIPYKLRRDKVNEGREQVPYFIREEITEAEDELQDTLEEILGEDVYKSDYREAAMVVAQRHPELVAEVLREWGYDLDVA